MPPPRKEIADVARGLDHSAFTLAEVLITLGIIGVVAAITMPTLISHHKALVAKTKFKKTLSVLSQSGATARALYDFSYSDADSCKNSGLERGNEKAETEKTICAIFNSTLKNTEYLGQRGLYGGSKQDIDNYSITEDRILTGYTNSGWMDIYNLNGVYFGAFKYAINCTKENPCVGFIDINGPAGPNKEITCTDGNATLSVVHDENYVPCKVNDNGITDIFPILFSGDGVIPASNAAASALLD